MIIIYSVIFCAVLCYVLMVNGKRIFCGGEIERSFIIRVIKNIFSNILRDPVFDRISKRSGLQNLSRN